MTSGAKASCDAPPPASPEAALAARPPGAGESVAYREEVSHPALARPEVAQGVFRLRGDGTLLREQTAPTPETATIGERYISIRRPGDETPRLAPLPEDLAAVTGLIRAALSNKPTEAPERLLEGFDAVLGDGPEGWNLTLTPKDPGARVNSIEMTGCGGRFISIAFAPRGSGATRRIVFGE